MERGSKPISNENGTWYSLVVFFQVKFLQDQDGTMALEKRFISIQSTKLTLKGFLTDKLFYFLTAAEFAHLPRG